jgi:hypothetical protein
MDRYSKVTYINLIPINITSVVSCITYKCGYLITYKYHFFNCISERGKWIHILVLHERRPTMTPVVGEKQSHTLKSSAPNTMSVSLHSLLSKIIKHCLLRFSCTNMHLSCLCFKLGAFCQRLRYQASPQADCGSTRMRYL